MTRLSYEVFYAVIFYTLSALISIGVNVVFYLRARKSELLSTFLNVQALLIIWLLAKVLKKASPNDEIAWFWVVVQYLAVCCFCAVFLDFAYLYKTGVRMKRWILKVLIGISLMNYIVAFTNEFHHLFFLQVTIDNNVNGPWFYVHTVYSYILIVICYYYLINALVKNNYEVPLLQAILFNVGLLLPIASNIIHVFKIVQFPFDITPIMFNVTIIIFGYSAYRYRFLDVKRVTRSMVLENIHEGIIIIDNNFRIVHVNNIIREMMRFDKSSGKIYQIEDFLRTRFGQVDNFKDIRQKISNCLNNHEDKMITGFNMDVHGSLKRYMLKVEKISDHVGDMAGYVFRTIDVTKHNELIESVQESNEALTAVNQQLSENISVARQLAVAKERSRVSKEVHDILGHSVTIVISLLEITKRALQTDLQLASEKTTQGMEIIRGGLIQLKKSMKQHYSDSIEANRLIEDLQKLIRDFEKSGVNVDFYYKEKDTKLSADIYDTVYRVCQEGLTNALRHGKATNVTIGVRYVERDIDLFVIDDGEGCSECSKGNGLSGMENRVKELNGYFSCGSPDGHGFNIHVTLPV